jgi:molecular chaperone GrpE
MNREEILERFERLLDSALATEEPPAGIPPELFASLAVNGHHSSAEQDRSCDSYALWAAMTSLVQEVRLQGRAFQELNHTLGAQTEKVAAELRAVWTERERNLQREAERRSRREILSSIIDLRDRLARGLETANASQSERKKLPPPDWLERLSANRAKRQQGDALQQEAIAAVLRGYELGLERLDQTLDEFNAREIRCQGEPFDPRRMNAIDSVESDQFPEGTVLEVYRSGYEWNGEVFRPAQVKVSRAPVTKIAGEGVMREAKEIMREANE